MEFLEKINSACRFMGRFLRHPLSVGSLVPSSPFLSKAMATAVALATGQSSGHSTMTAPPAMAMAMVTAVMATAIDFIDFIDTTY